MLFSIEIFLLKRTPSIVVPTLLMPWEQCLFGTWEFEVFLILFAWITAFTLFKSFPKRGKKAVNKTHLFRQVLEIFFAFYSSSVFFQTFNNNFGSFFQEKSFDFAFSFSFITICGFLRSNLFWLVWSWGLLILFLLLLSLFPTFLSSLSEKNDVSE